MNRGPKISAEQAVKTSLVVDTLDVLLNGCIAYASGSVIMFTEALQGLADLTAAAFLLLGVKSSSRLADKKHPFGYGREIYIWTFLSTFLMMTFLSGASIYFGWQRLHAPREIEYFFLAISVLLFSVLTNGYALSVSAKRLGNGNVFAAWSRFHDSPLVETKATFVLDGLGTMAALFGLIAMAGYRLTGETRFDAYGAIAIGVLMIAFGFVLLMKIHELLLGRGVDAQTEQAIRRATLSVPGVQAVLDLRAIHVGSERILINIEVHARDNQNTDELERMIDSVKTSITSAVPEAFHIQVELETPE